MRQKNTIGSTNKVKYIKKQEIYHFYFHFTHILEISRFEVPISRFFWAFLQGLQIVRFGGWQVWWYHCVFVTMFYRLLETMLLTISKGLLLCRCQVFEKIDDTMFDLNSFILFINWLWWSFRNCVHTCRCKFKKPTLTFGGCQFTKTALVIWWTILPVLILKGLPSPKWPCDRLLLFSNGFIVLLAIWLVARIFLRVRKLSLIFKTNRRQRTRSDLHQCTTSLYKSFGFHERHLLPKTLELSVVHHVNVSVT